MGIKHTKVSNVADSANTNLVRPTDWNDDHTIDGDVDFGGHSIVNANLPAAGVDTFIELTDVPADYSGEANKLVAVNPAATGLTFIEPSAGGPVDEFTDLLDVPGTYSGQAGKVAAVNTGETALEFIDTGGAISIQQIEPASPASGEIWVNPSTQLLSVSKGHKWDWNKKSTLFEVSDDGLEANVIAGTAAGFNEFILGTAPLTGKMVFGFSIHNTLTSTLTGNQLVGVANMEFVTADDGFFLGGRRTSCAYAAAGGGVIYQQVTEVTPPGVEYVDGDLNYIAVDADAKLFWARTGSNDWNWDAGADPGAGTGGVDISNMAGTIWPATGTRIIGDVITLIPDPAIVLPTGFVAYSTATPFTEVGYLDKPNIEKKEVNPRHYGAVGDGRSHPLSQYYATLADAQEVYSFATSLDQEVDWAACMLAGHVAWGRPGFENGGSFLRNRPIYIPEGVYVFGDDSWLIRNLAGTTIRGAGKMATRLTSTGANNAHVMIFDGVWYTTIENIAFYFANTDAAAVSCLDMDGNFPGHPYDTRSEQGCTVKDCFFYAAGAPYCFTLNLYGGGGSQGDGNCFINLHMSGATEACYAQFGQNSVSNHIIGGDCQNYEKYGILIQGACDIYGTSFESTTGFYQVVNDGWDIYLGQSGAVEPCCVYGCRSESVRFLKAGSACITDLRNFAHRPAQAGWISNFFYSPNYPFAPLGILVTSSDGHPTWMMATVPGSSAVGTEPAWPAYGSGATVNDGSQVWVEQAAVVIDVHDGVGSIDRKTIWGCHGLVKGSYGVNSNQNVTYTNDNLRFGAEFVSIDATSGAFDFHLQRGGTEAQDTWLGRTITITKSDASANAVTIKTNGAPLIYPMGTNTDTLTLQNETKTYTWFDNGSFYGYLMTAATGQLASAHSAIAAETVTGYLTIKDASGTLRKVAVVS